MPLVPTPVRVKRVCACSPSHFYRKFALLPVDIINCVALKDNSHTNCNPNPNHEFFRNTEGPLSLSCWYPS
jgi:hypothetical protein